MKSKDFRFVVDSYVAGIPCKLGVIEVGYYEPAYRGGHPDDWAPEDSEEHTYAILDRKGYSAEWLEIKCAREDRDRHQKDIDSYLIGVKNDY